MRKIVITIILTSMYAGPAVGQGGFANDVPIHVGWVDSNEPNLVEFDGGPPFVRSGSEYVGKRTRPGKWVTHDLAITFNADAFPLRVVTQAGSEPVRVRVIKAVYSQCSLSDVRAIYSANPATVNARIALMINARNLLVSNKCPEGERWKLAKRYFDTSCSLASDPNSSIELSPDAQNLYRRYAVTPSQKREAETCTGKVQQRAIIALRDEAERAKRAGDNGGFAAVNGELLSHAESPLWQDGFAALRINGNHIRAEQVDQLYDSQMVAYHRRDTETALEFNEELRDLASTPEYREAFKSVKIDPERLSEDRFAIISRGNAGPN